MPRFVLLHHELPPAGDRASHWDLMLELPATGRLATWALAELPQPGCAIAATRLADHRADYLAYEGPVSGNRGSVRRIDSGDYATTLIQPTCWEIELAGTLLCGTATLQQTADDQASWQFHMAKLSAIQSPQTED